MSRIVKKSGKSEGLGIRSIKYEALLILLPTVLLSMIILSLLGYITAKQVFQDRINHEMELSLSTSVEKIEKSLSNNRKVSEALAKTVESNADVMTMENYQKMLTNLVGTNAETFGGGIWFEPYAFSTDKQYFSPYCMREDGKIKYVEDYSLGDDIYYTDQDWYTNVAGSDKSAKWSAPYFDNFVKISMVTASVPFYDSSDKLMGVATTDMDLTELQNMIVSMQTNADEKVFLIDNNGTYIADEDSTKLLKANIKEDSNASFAKLGESILNGVNGKGSYLKDGKNFQVWFAVIPESGWKIAVANSEVQLFGSITTLGRNLALLCGIFTVLLSAVIIIYVRSGIVKPLASLSGVTSQIADGNLDIHVSNKSKNEIGIVFSSLRKTVDILRQYSHYISEISSVLDQISERDLNFYLQLDYFGEFSKLKFSMNKIKLSLNQTLSQINNSADQVNSGSTQVSSTSHALAAGATEQASAVEELSESISKVAEHASENASNVSQTARYVEQTSSSVQDGNLHMAKLTDAMNEIGLASRKITSITKLIEDIAFQTNILALNAAVEAARAGNSGKGFAVVADEVRNLAAKSAEAAKQTGELIQHSTRTITEGTKVAVETAQILRDISDKSDLVKEIIKKIELASSEQATAIEQITQGLSQVSAVVQTNAATAEESSAASQELSAQAEMLRKEVGKFKFSEDVEVEDSYGDS